MTAHASTDSGKRPAGPHTTYHPWYSSRFFAARRRAGFTIVELLVVVGVIAILLAITVPVLRGVQTRTRKTVESNNIRQVYLAWTVYGNFNRDAAAPGHLSPDVQKAWRVGYEYPIPPDPGKPHDRAIPEEIAAPWTWRLSPYFDHNLEVIWRYRNVPTMNWPALAALARDGALDYDGIGDVDGLMEAYAEQPAFGYNAFHVGGWWEMQPVPGGGDGKMPLPRFYNAKSIGGSGHVDVVSRSIANIRRPADLIVFCTTAHYAEAGVQRSQDDQRAGSHLAMPPFLAEEARWESPPSSKPQQNDLVGTIMADTHAPLGRYNGMPTLINADGSIETNLPVVLFDMRRWIDNPVRSDEPYDAWFNE